MCIYGWVRDVPIYGIAPDASATSAHLSLSADARSARARARPHHGTQQHIM